MILIVTPIYLIEKGISLPLVTLIAGIGYLPWGLKFVWGGIIDFFHKHGRKKFAVVGTIAGAFGFFILSLIDQSFSIIFFTLFLLLGYVGIGFLDSAADAWAIDISKKEERGKINCSMIIGKWVGQYIGALIIISIAVSFGYSISFLVSGLLVLVLVIVPISVKYEDRKIHQLRIWKLIRTEFKKITTKLTTLYFLIIVLQHALFFTFLVLYLKVVLDLDDTYIGILFALWLVVVVPGSIIGGVLSDKFGRKRPLYFFLVLVLIFSITPIFLSDFIHLIINFSILLFFLNGVISGNWAMIMDIINPKISASQHEIICSIVNFGSIIIGSATGTLFVVLGADNIFILVALLTLLSIMILYTIKGLDNMKWNT
ncbi:MAG: MFS transporter [Thermoplasmatales archaeon]|nr:MAG: MFS transporter [Thermoplasmatales archaeon]